MSAAFPLVMGARQKAYLWSLYSDESETVAEAAAREARKEQREAGADADTDEKPRARAKPQLPVPDGPPRRGRHVKFVPAAKMPHRHEEWEIRDADDVPSVTDKIGSVVQNVWKNVFGTTGTKKAHQHRVPRRKIVPATPKDDVSSDDSSGGAASQRRLRKRPKVFAAAQESSDDGEPEKKAPAPAPAPATPRKVPHRHEKIPPPPPPPPPPPAPAPAAVVAAEPVPADEEEPQPAAASTPSAAAVGLGNLQAAGQALVSNVENWVMNIARGATAEREDDAKTPKKKAPRRTPSPAAARTPSPAAARRVSPRSKAGSRSVSPAVEVKEEAAPPTPAKPRSKSPAKPRSKSPAKPKPKTPAKPRPKSPAKPRSKSPAKPRSKSPAKPKSDSPTPMRVTRSATKAAAAKAAAKVQTTGAAVEIVGWSDDDDEEQQAAGDDEACGWWCEADETPVEVADVKKDDRAGCGEPGLHETLLLLMDGLQHMEGGELQDHETLDGIGSEIRLIVLTAVPDAAFDYPGPEECPNLQDRKAYILRLTHDLVRSVEVVASCNGQALDTVYDDRNLMKQALGSMETMERRRAQLTIACQRDQEP